MSEVETIVCKTATEYYVAKLILGFRPLYDLLVVAKWERSAIAPMTDNNSYDGPFWSVSYQVWNGRVHWSFNSYEPPYSPPCQEFVDRVLKLKAFL